jgi:predicted DNA-binding transcriptional regulator AlpA
MPGQLITVADVAAKTTLTPSTIYTWRHRKTPGVPRGFLLGGRVVFDEAEVDAWIDAQRAPRAPATPERTRTGRCPTATRPLTHDRRTRSRSP